MADQEEKRIIVKVAYNYFQSGHWDRALDEYKKLIAIDPMDFLVHNMLAEIYTRKNDKEEAIREYMNAASLLRATNSIEKALLAYSRIIKLDPNHTGTKEKIDEVIRIRLADADRLLEQGAYDQALEICERISERLPEHPLVLEKIVDIEKRRQQPAAVKSSPASAPEPDKVSNKEDVVKNLFSLAASYEAKQAWDEAVEAYITILRLMPEDESTRTKLHDLYRRITRQDKAADVWARITTEDTKRLEHAKHLAKTRPQSSSASEILKAASTGQDANVVKMQKLGQQAEVNLRRAVEDRRERDKNRQEAPAGPAAGMREAFVFQTPTSDQEIGVLLTQAHMYIQQNMLVEAMRLSQRILELEPQNQEVRILLQKIFEKKNL